MKKNIPQKHKSVHPQSPSLIAPPTFEDALMQTGHKGKLPLKVIAEKEHISYWHLAHGISSRPPSLSCRHLTGFMEYGGPDPILQYLAWRFSYTLIPPPKHVGDLIDEVFKTTDAWLALSRCIQGSATRARKNSTNIAIACDDLIAATIRLKMAARGIKK